MIKVIKRNGNIVNFQPMKILNAIKSAMKDTPIGFDSFICNTVVMKVQERINSLNKTEISVNEIQDIVEEELMKTERIDVAKKYILYRKSRDEVRNFKQNFTLLDDEFISQYKHEDNPIKTQVGNFVYSRTYSRWLPEEKRREFWWETVRRAVEYNCSLAPTTKEEAQELFDNIFHLRQFPSGRTLWVGGTEVALEYPMSNYNCSFLIIENFEAFKELFYLLMLGSGVGFRILKSDVAKLPKVRNNYNLIHEEYSYDKEKLDNSNINFISNETVKIKIGDSKEGWSQAIETYFKLIYSHEFKNIKTIILNYNYVRPKGAKLKKFGGTASGHESLKNMFMKIDKVIKNASSEERFNLRPIHCLDIANIIGENVVSGGVRRTSEIGLIDVDDEECIKSKSQLYKQTNGKWEIDRNIAHRQMSNNSIFYDTKPSREQLHWNFEQIRYSGEPAFINHEAMKKRKSDTEGINPCAEILLDNKQQCNLVTINVFAFVKEDGTLDYEGLFRAQYLSARMALRMTCVELELPEWSVNQKKDRLTGCSMTGWQDMVNAVKMSKIEEIRLLKALREKAHEASNEYSKQLNIENSALICTVKPEGTISQIPTVASGIHYSHSPYFIRRVRISSNDPLCKVCEELEYPVYPEVGQDPETCVTKYVEFPVKAPEGKTKYDVSAIEQLENYKMFMENYVDHNCSITISVRDNEWAVVEEWVWNNWDTIVGVSFISLDDNFYKAMPYESITKEEYEKRLNSMKPFVSSIISKYEIDETELDLGNESCSNGICPVR